MTTEENLYIRIVKECDKLIDRHQKYHNKLHISWLRSKKRLVTTPTKEIKIPEYWKIDKKFNPFYVKGNARAIAKSIAIKIANGSYTPEEPYVKEIPKSNGGKRKLTIYQIPDAAVSGFYYSRLLIKNKHRFSSFSYAYRNDRNVHFAIQDIAVDLSNDVRTFIAEFDFSNFFGEIRHEYLYAQFDQNGFLISEEDRMIIRAFLKPMKEKGIPQGVSVSLFLANLVCWRLDKSIEKAGLKFARYADDTVIWSPNYASICNAFVLVNNFSTEVGVPINLKKSDGINLLTSKGMTGEIRAKTKFDFLGYALGIDDVSIKDASLVKIKKQICYLLYRNLIQPLKGDLLVNMEVPSNNKDIALLSAISQIRRYLYGGLLHEQLHSFIKGRISKIYFKGVMSFYPLLNNEKQLSDLNGWLVSVIYRSIALRSKLLKKHGFDRDDSFPFNVSKENLVAQCRKKILKGERILEIPSFILIFKALKKGLIDSGIEHVMHPESIKYEYRL